MGKTLSKIKDVEYNELVTLVLLYKEKRLWNIFKDELKLPINTLITLAKNNGLSSSSKDTLTSIFEEVISIDSTILSKYETLLKNSAELENDVTDSEPTNNEVVVEKTADIVADIKPVETKPEKKKVNRKLPRRMGKEAIEKMIAESGGKSNQVQRAILVTNELKNLYVRLNSKLIKELFGVENTMTDEEYNSIRATITIIKNKIEPILKKK